jgi:hypothetical protein
MSPDPLKDKAMLKPPGPIAPRSYVEAYQRQQAELEQRRAVEVRPDYFASHPGLAESLIPVWGSGREAIADFKEGDVPGGIINGVAAASDLFLAGSAAKGAGKLVLGAAAHYAKKRPIGKLSAEALAGGLRQLQKDAAILAKPTRAGGPPWDYKRVQPRMKRYGMVKDGQQLHHYAAPQSGWGEAVPNVIKNNPLSLHPMPKQAHQLTHNNLPSEGLKRYGPLQRYIEATPAWTKAATVGAGTHGVGAVKRTLDDRQ